jgi:hypothetical protein
MELLSVQITELLGGHSGHPMKYADKIAALAKSRLISDLFNGERSRYQQVLGQQDTAFRQVMRG